LGIALNRAGLEAEWCFAVFRSENEHEIEIFLNQCRVLWINLFKRNQMAKVAVVTGSSGNLGQEVVRKFIAEGYKVIGTVIPNDPTPMDFLPKVLKKLSI
jgi:hypothetical protein